MPSPTDSTWPISAISAFLLQNRRISRRTDFHRCPFSPVAFIASRRRCSRLFNEASTIREPILTIMPPRRPGSTRMSTATRAPTARRRPRLVHGGSPRPGADLDDHAAEEAGVDPNVDRDAGPDRTAQLFDER